MPNPRLRSRCAWAWLWLALLLAPSLGQMHRVLHLPGSSSAAELPAQGLAAWFAGHSPADCEQLDQLCHASAPPWLPGLAPAPLPSAQPPAPAAQAPRPAQALAFHARAPPVEVSTPFLIAASAC